jgi:hypothetical protein
MLTAQPVVTEDGLTAQTARFLHGRGFESEAEAEQAASEFMTFCRGRMWVFSEAGITPTGTRLYSFTHRTFLEYFAAAHLAYSCDSPERLARALAPRIAAGQWAVIGELATQIKDRTSNDGADRIMRPILASASRRAPAGRSRSLQFAARCLRSASPTVRTVRDLTRQILSFLCDGDLDDPDRNQPLAWLIASSGAWRDQVADELTAHLTTMTSSDDPATHLAGLRIGAWLLVGVSENSSGRRPAITSGSQIQRFWSDWERVFIDSHGADITAAAVHDTALRDRALSYDLMTVSEALRLPGGLTALLTSAPMGIFGCRETSFLLKDAYTLLTCCTDDSGPGHLASHFADLGQHLTRCTKPPWTGTPLHPWSNFFTECARPRTAIVRLDPLAYAGAAAIILMAAESQQRGASTPGQLGPLSDLCPYLSRRSGTTQNPDPLPVLPVPPSFQAIFSDWAHNKLSLASD